MRSGRLNKKITIQKTTQAQSSIGEATDTWLTYAVRWASIEPLLGREYFESQQVNAEETIRFRIRYLSGVTPKMRISWDSRLFDIRSVVNVGERNKEMLLMAVENVSNS